MIEKVPQLERQVKLFFYVVGLMRKWTPFIVGVKIRSRRSEYNFLKIPNRPMKLLLIRVFINFRLVYFE